MVIPWFDDDRGAPGVNFLLFFRRQTGDDLPARRLALWPAILDIMEAPEETLYLGWTDPGVGAAG